jgi:hypothetical protein
MSLPLVPHHMFASSSPPTSPSMHSEAMKLEGSSISGEEATKLRVLVQPNDVQVKRVGRASCIEPDIKLCVEMDSPYPKTISVNAYLKVLGKDNKHKLILLRKSDDITFSKAHKREIVGMKLRFLKTIKVQVLKRNLGVSRPEASIVFEAVSKDNEFEGAVSTNNFAIISDPRYLDEVKHRRASERNEPSQLSDDEYRPSGGVGGVGIRKSLKRRRLDKPGKYLAMSEEPASPSDQDSPSMPHIEDTPYSYHYEDMAISPPLSSPSPVFTPSSSTPSPTPIPSSSSDALQALKECADDEFSTTDVKEEQRRLVKLVEALKHKGCNFHILPPRAQF